jgi:O-antigen/teichoic acid export membrane protein
MNIRTSVQTSIFVYLQGLVGLVGYSFVSHRFGTEMRGELSYVTLIANLSAAAMATGVLDHVTIKHSKLYSLPYNSLRLLTLFIPILTALVSVLIVFTVGIVNQDLVSLDFMVAVTFFAVSFAIPLPVVNSLLIQRKIFTWNCVNVVSSANFVIAIVMVAVTSNESSRTLSLRMAATFCMLNTLLTLFLFLWNKKLLSPESFRVLSDARVQRIRFDSIQSISPLIASAFVSAYFYRLDLFYLGFTADRTELGLYAAAIGISSLLTVLPRVIVSLALPALAASDNPESRVNLAKLLKYTICASCVIYVVSFQFHEMLLVFLNGSEFSAAKTLSSILLLAWLLDQIYLICDRYLKVYKRYVSISLFSLRAVSITGVFVYCIQMDYGSMVFALVRVLEAAISLTICLIFIFSERNSQR